MWRDAGHQDYVHLHNPDEWQKAEQRAATLATTDDPCIPNGLAEILEDGTVVNLETVMIGGATCCEEAAA